MPVEAGIDLRVRAMERLADGILSLTLEHPDGGDLPPWSAGAHVDLVFEGIGTAQYSLCGPLGAKVASCRAASARGARRFTPRSSCTAAR